MADEGEHSRIAPFSDFSSENTRIDKETKEKARVTVVLIGRKRGDTKEYIKQDLAMLGLGCEKLTKRGMCGRPIVDTVNEVCDRPGDHIEDEFS